MKKQIEEFEKRMVLCQKEIEDLEKEVEEASAEKRTFDGFPKRFL